MARSFAAMGALRGDARPHPGSIAGHGHGPLDDPYVAGLTMGMMLFLMASGLTLIFGLMDVLNFAHAAFITTGAYVAVSVLGGLPGWTTESSLALNLAALLLALSAAAAASGALGFVFEQIIIRRVYGAPLRQILITVGALIVIEQLVIVVWGPDRSRCPSPPPCAAACSSARRPSKRTGWSRSASAWYIAAVMQLVLNSHPHRSAGARGRRGSRDGGVAWLPYSAPVHRRVHRRHCASRYRRDDVGPIPGHWSTVRLAAA